MQGLLVLIYFLFIIFTYVWFAYWLYQMAQARGLEYPWFAWIPVLNIVCMWQLSGLDILWVILCFVPCANIVALIYIWMEIADSCGEERWFGILMIIPVVNYWAIWKLAQEV